MFTTTLTALVLAAKMVSAATHVVVVGGPDLLAFTPSYVKAQVGDVVRFDLYVQYVLCPFGPSVSRLHHSRVKNHTATQSSFLKPCSPLAGGFDSGL